MCGLAGSFALPAFDVRAALDRIRHRGPDGSGVLDAGPAKKETFQGGAGMDSAAAQVIPDPARFYRSVIATAYGPVALKQ